MEYFYKNLVKNITFFVSFQFLSIININVWHHINKISYQLLQNNHCFPCFDYHLQIVLNHYLICCQNKKIQDKESSWQQFIAINGMYWITIWLIDWF